MQRTTTAAGARPDDVLAALQSAEAALTQAPHPSPVHGSRAGWAEVVARAQRVINAAAAVQDEAMVALAAIETETLDDGTTVEVHRTPGHVALDAPAVISGVLTVSSRHAEHRVRAAVRLAADGPSGTHTATGLHGLHEAMADGRLDSYRAGVLADELEEAPPEVAAAVVQSLESYFDSETGPRLRARCRRVLATISPDLLRQRATRAREQCGLRRWAQEPGVDQWEGAFPSEDAARAWAAIDARAQQLRADGTFSRIERARAQALIDLVTGSATVTTVLTLTVPAAAVDDDRPPLDDATRAWAPSAPRSDIVGDTAPVARRSDTVADSPSISTSEVLSSASSASEVSSLASPDDLVEVTVSGVAQPVLVSRAFLKGLAEASETQTVTGDCHPRSGALLGSGASTAYRPPAALAALVRQRDSRCRFPGCHVSARFCDLDHVRPWPNGPTHPNNLICLCRRHHRVKQRHGWNVRLAPDGQCTWTDPTGRVHTTSAIDALHTLVLHEPHATTGGPPAPPEHPREPTDAPEPECDPEHPSTTTYEFGMSDQHSGLEFVLEHHAAAITTAELTRTAALRTVWRPGASAPTRLTLDVHRPHRHHGRTARSGAAAWPPIPGHRTSPRGHGPPPSPGRDSDEPPF